MITIQTYLFEHGRKTGYRGSGSVNCPYCDTLADVGTGEHGVPDVALCNCGKWFSYWPSGRTAKVNAKRQNLVSNEDLDLGNNAGYREAP